jgi:hypothetical protein
MKPTTRDPLEIQRAHDILVAWRLGKVPPIFQGDAETAAHSALDVLCWVLNHDHNKAFGENLETINTTLENLGYRLRDSGELSVPEHGVAEQPEADATSEPLNPKGEKGAK